MDYKARYESWLNESVFDDAFIKELKSIPEKDLEESFYKELEFGTAGLRGINGAGSNRMNKYVIRRASQGYADYLLAESRNSSCAIAYDNRRFSKFFAMEAARVLSANGIKTYIYSELRPTPQLSFTIIHLNCTGGIVCTASHNPPEYSGYKVYGRDGAQLNTENASKVSDFILNGDGFSGVKISDFEAGIEKGYIEWLGEDMDDAFISALKKELIHPETLCESCKTLYTPLHGTGGTIMKKLFDTLGLEDANYLEEQMRVDPEFTTCKSPNPEDEASFKLSKKRGKEIGAELLIASDPDADRLGCMLMKDGEYKKINGNQIGALIAYYLFSEKKNMPVNPCMVKSIVTSDLSVKIAEDFGIDTRETLTGFKNICGIIREFEEVGNPDFIMGFEESYGYLVGTHCRDKDSIVSTMILIDMIKFYKSKGKTLFDVLNEIYEKYGYYKDDLIALVKPGKSGMQEISSMMQEMRTHFKDKIAPFGLEKIYDYKSLEITDYKNGSIEKIEEENSNVLKYKMNDGSWIAMRPSGTEPKIKFYFCIIAENEKLAQNKLIKYKSLLGL